MIKPAPPAQSMGGALGTLSSGAICWPDQDVRVTISRGDNKTQEMTRKYRYN